MDIMFNELVEIDKDFFALRIFAEDADMVVSRYYADVWRYALFEMQKTEFSVDLRTVLFKHTDEYYYIEVWFSVNKNIGDKQRNFDMAFVELQKALTQAIETPERYYDSDDLVRQTAAGTYVEPWKQQTEDFMRQLKKDVTCDAWFEGVRTAF